jgi:hypothetical protein
MSHRPGARLAWSLWGLALCLAAAGLLLGVLTFRVSLPEGREPFLVPILVQGVLLVLYGTLGALISSRQSRNLIGWLFLVVAVSLGILSVAYGYEDYALYARNNSLPGAELAARVTDWLFIVAVYGSVCYLFLLFPNGRPTSPRWCPVVWGVTITAVVAILAAALDPGPPSAFPTVKNPLQFGESIGRVAPVVNDITDFAAIPVFLVSLASMITRLRHAGGRERLQLKWMTYAASLTATSFAVAFLASLLLGWQRPSRTSSSCWASQDLPAYQSRQASPSSDIASTR